jgi:hypothetical protein
MIKKSKGEITSASLASYVHSNEKGDQTQNNKPSQFGQDGFNHTLSTETRGL